MKLTVNEYNKFEKEGKWKLSNRFLEAFQPDVFNKIGFPAQIEDNRELFRYVDSMHDGRLAHYYHNMGFAPTADEFEDIKTLSKDIYEFSLNNYHIGVLPKAPFLTSSHVVRKIKAISAGSQKPRVFELGGGWSPRNYAL